MNLGIVYQKSGDLARAEQAPRGRPGLPAGIGPSARDARGDRAETLRGSNAGSSTPKRCCSTRWSARAFARRSARGSAGTGIPRRAGAGPWTHGTRARAVRRVRWRWPSASRPKVIWWWRSSASPRGVLPRAGGARARAGMRRPGRGVAAATPGRRGVHGSRRGLRARAWHRRARRPRGAGPLRRPFAPVGRARRDGADAAVARTRSRGRTRGAPDVLSGGCPVRRIDVALLARAGRKRTAAPRRAGAAGGGASRSPCSARPACARPGRVLAVHARRGADGSARGDHRVVRADHEARPVPARS